MRMLFLCGCGLISEQIQRTANACYKDAADLHAELGEYLPAIARYEQVADHSLTSALTKYSVKEYWLRAGLCALALKVYFTAFTCGYL
jgi:alpha-soluble NSF attachment protein